jgi:hypothetical protein
MRLRVDFDGGEAFRQVTTHPCRLLLNFFKTQVLGVEQGIREEP